MLAAVVLAFDLTSVLALMYPGRERVEIVGLDGVTYVYACKPGPAGQTPAEQGALAQDAFEENAERFGDTIAAGIVRDIEAGAPTLGLALEMTRKTEGWAGAITLHLEKTYGCALLG